MKKYICVTPALLLLFAFSSCRKVVDINLNSASPQIVVEGGISDAPGPYRIKLSRTVNFSETNSFPPVSGAVLSLQDDAGNSETLTEIAAGTYQGTRLQGVSGRTYTLLISAKGKNYSASSTLPFPVGIDTLVVQKSIFGKEKFIGLEFQDSVGIKNYYRLIEVINGVAEKSIFIMNDDLQDGKKIDYILFSREDSLAAGDSVAVLLQSIDKNVYMYFNTLDQISNGGGQSATPTNPTSNISNGALGYFSAYAVRSKSIIVP